MYLPPSLFTLGAVIAPLAVINQVNAAPPYSQLQQATSAFFERFSDIVDVAQVPIFNAVKLKYLRPQSLDERSDFFERCADLGESLQKYASNLLNQAASDMAGVTPNIAAFKETMTHLVESTSKFRTDASFNTNQVSEQLSTAFAYILEEAKAEFPPPEEAPGHEEREKMVASLMLRVEDSIVHITAEHGMTEERVRAHLDEIRPGVQRLIVITGDLIEEHPVLFETLLFSAAAALIPESWLLRPILSLFGFGPYGPVKGSAASWLQRRFWGGCRRPA
ncbi:hypothetical protein EW146_g4062 [Bondarzewia mesenterica]|uniref:Uncharacterized protein n=1 Tax=Bondarzewia mesenterica TaxID=1095465 RepID=A0A4S4LXV7_9AGAM|nr:hypothetical protein EW146_g4062 [Bondarzewia mesenterica]